MFPTNTDAQGNSVTMKLSEKCIQRGKKDVNKSIGNIEVIKKPHDARLKHKKQTCCMAGGANQQQHRLDNSFGQDQGQDVNSSIRKFFHLWLQAANCSLYHKKRDQIPSWCLRDILIVFSDVMSNSSLVIWLFAKQTYNTLLVDVCFNLMLQVVHDIWDKRWWCLWMTQDTQTSLCAAVTPVKCVTAPKYWKSTSGKNWPKK